MDLSCIILNARSDTHKAIYSLVLFKWHSGQGKVIVVARGWGEGEGQYKKIAWRNFEGWSNCSVLVCDNSYKTKHFWILVNTNFKNRKKNSWVLAGKDTGNYKKQ